MNPIHNPIFVYDFLSLIRSLGPVVQPELPAAPSDSSSLFNSVTGNVKPTKSSRITQTMHSKTSTIELKNEITGRAECRHLVTKSHDTFNTWAIAASLFNVPCHFMPAENAGNLSFQSGVQSEISRCMEKNGMHLHSLFLLGAANTKIMENRMCEPVKVQQNTHISFISLVIFKASGWHKRLWTQLRV